MTTEVHAVDEALVREFLAGHRIVVVGASEEERNFGHTIYTELAKRGYDVVAVHPTAATCNGDLSYPRMAAVPDGIHGVIVVVNADAALDVVRECIAYGVPRIWLFKGIGGRGAVSDDAVALCEKNGVAVIPGACPLMFLEPVAWIHRVHRAVRHAKGTLIKAV